ncbi:MAG: hypothetical protein HY758_02915, partial [Nitrospirae bacterium]|nr:hypothetical protein [Nitrospirota bacterium]
MKKNLILIVVIFSLLFLYEWSADAATRIVYKSGASPCKIGDTYHNSIQAAVDMTTFNNNEYQPGDTIIVCPGLYNENVSIVAFEFQGHDWFNLTLRSYTQNTSDPLNPSKNAIIQAPAGSKKNTIYLRAWLDGITISGFTITGANGAAPCQDGGYDNDPKSADYYPQPCAGIRVYCVENQSFNPGKIINNVFTGNNAGIVIKDTSYA